MGGGFESAEIELAIEHARPGSVVFDVGANVGIFTIPLAHAVGRLGRVIAVEPAPENVLRLEQNVHLNELSNVAVEAIAVGEAPGFLALQLSSDSAFHSTTAVGDCHAMNGEMIVAAKTLDDLWRVRELDDWLGKFDYPRTESSRLCQGNFVYLGAASSPTG